jgi:hypothetical protein
MVVQDTGSRRAIRLNNKFRLRIAGSITAKERHQSRIDRNISGRVERLGCKILYMLDADDSFIPPETSPRQEIDFLAPQPCHAAKQKHLERLRIDRGQFSGAVSIKLPRSKVAKCLVPGRSVFTSENGTGSLWRSRCTDPPSRHRALAALAGAGTGRGRIPIRWRVPSRRDRGPWKLRPQGLDVSRLSLCRTPCRLIWTNQLGELGGLKIRLRR